MRISIPDTGTVSAILDVPTSPVACFVMAHGAGAGMTHPFMAAAAAALVRRSLAVLRFQFPYMEKKSKRPDTPAVAHAAIRAAAAHAAKELPGVPLFAGGKSFGGRMTSQAQAAEPLADVRGLIFLGFPLHPAGKPSDDRADHLADVQVPMLFLQGTRDELAELELLRPVIKKLGTRATLRLFDEADHSFHVPAKTGRKDADVLEEMCETIAEWTAQR